MGCGCSKSSKDEVEKEIDLTNFHLLRSVGRGAFGKVRIIQNKKDKSIYALKYINKEKCIKMKAVKHIIQERQLLEQVEHPFLVNLRYAFQDDENMFLVLDLMLGGDLRYHLERSQKFSEDCVCIFVAEIASALNYLHSEGIVHRDLKPDNILLDAQGHCHLTDFNISTFLPKDGAVLKSVAGTPAYMAPEMLKKAGYREEVDYWSLGVCMYEIMFGKRPFDGKTTSKLHKSIRTSKLIIPKTPSFSEECMDFLQKLLCRKKSERLGCGPRKFDEIKEHPFMAQIDWQKLIKKECKPGFTPDQKKANFDVTYELEEVLLEDNPLKFRKRITTKLEDMSPEMQQIEVGFISFNTNALNGRQALTEERKFEVRNTTLAVEEQIKDDSSVRAIDEDGDDFEEDNSGEDNDEVDEDNEVKEENDGDEADEDVDKDAPEKAQEQENIEI